jgi:acyl transferase domain-containing protein
MPQNGGPVRVSLNSFGYGGTNCHVILEAVDPGKNPDRANGIGSNGIGSNGIKSNGVKSNGVKPNGVKSNGVKSNGVKSNGVKPNGIQSPEKNQEERRASELPETTSASPLSSTLRPELIVLSASTEKALLSRAEDLRLWIETHDLAPHTLHSLAYTLGAHRSALPYRRATVASTLEELAAELKVPGPQKRSVPVVPVTFVFSGQGAQWHAMGLELLHSSPVFQQSISAMEDELRHQGCPWSLTKELSRSPEYSRVGEAEIAQPATTAIQIALVDLLEAFSIRPSRVVGHSSGEIAAAYAAGALSRESAIRM